MPKNKKYNGEDIRYDETDYDDDLRERADESLPPRNVLESDSAKYTAEYIKEVVKDLYSTDTHAYVDSKGSAVYKPLKGENQADEVFTEPDDFIRRRAPEERPKGVYENHQPRPESDDFYEPDDSWHSPGFIKEGTQREEQKHKAREQGVFDRESFFREYEERMSREKNSGERPAKERKSTFSSTAIDTSRVERVLDGRSGARRDEFVYAKDIADYGGADEKAAERPSAEFHRTRPLADEVLEEERIPIVINNNIVGKPRKTAAESKGQSGRSPKAKQSAYAKKHMPEDNYSDRGRGINVFAVVFMSLCVIVIGLLVYRINVLSKELNEGGAEEIIVLEDTVARLTEENSSLQSQVTKLNEEIEQLNAEIESKAAADNEDNDNEVTAADSEEEQYYTVKSGDSLYKIAKELMGNGNLYPKLAEANNLDPNKGLITGTKLIIPK